MHLEIRPADAPRLDDALRVYARWFRRMWRDGRIVAWKVESSDGTIAASGALWFRETQPRPGELGGYRPYLMSMYTEPEFRGRGLAARLVRAAIAESRRRKYGLLTLHASTMGRGVYERLGFEAGSEMRLSLPRPVQKRRGAGP